MTKSELNNFLIVLDRQKTYEIVPKIFKLTIGEPIGLRRIKFLKIIFSLRIISEHSIVLKKAINISPTPPCALRKAPGGIKPSPTRYNPNLGGLDREGERRCLRNVQRVQTQWVEITCEGLDQRSS